jgi:hypothetical protein
VELIEDLLDVGVLFGLEVLVVEPDGPEGLWLVEAYDVVRLLPESPAALPRPYWDGRHQPGRLFAAN